MCELVGEDRGRLGRPAEHRERLLGGDRDGVGLGGGRVGAAPRAVEELDRDLAPVELEHLVVDVDVPLPRRLDRVRVEARAGGDDLPGEQRVLGRVADPDDDLDLVAGDTLGGRSAVLARERLDAGRGVDGRDLDPLRRGVAIGPEVDVRLAEQLRLLRRHRPGLDERRVLLRVGGVVRRGRARRRGERAGDECAGRDHRYERATSASPVAVLRHVELPLEVLRSADVSGQAAARPDSSSAMLSW